jgi:hypothetical protein
MERMNFKLGSRFFLCLRSVLLEFKKIHVLLRELLVLRSGLC